MYRTAHFNCMLFICVPDIYAFDIELEQYVLCAFIHDVYYMIVYIQRINLIVLRSRNHFEILLGTKLFVNNAH